MTIAQRTRLYFPAWHRAARNQGWLMRQGRLLGARVPSYGSPDLDEVYQAVWSDALARAARDHRAPVADDLRHACHVVALGRDKSSTRFSDAELDRLVSLFRLLADPDDLDAMRDWLHPENATRARMEWFISRRCHPGYVAALCRARFGTPEFYSLSPACLQELFWIVKKRPNALLKSEISNPQSEAADAAPIEQPF